MLTTDLPVVFWLVLAILAAIVEVSIPHFGVVFVSAGAVAAAALAFAGAGLALEILGFAVVLGFSLAILRPRLLAKLGARGVPSRTEALVGKRGLVTEDINSTVGTGRVNVGGEDWAARSATPLAAGVEVRVTGADGIVLEVTPS
jgi:membrane protein implicated in regulation of membrane protease activity